MIEKTIFDLVKQYINGWKQNDLAMLVSCLAENCLIIESHGPTYRGISAVEQWFKLWLAAHSKVIKWDIRSFCEIEKAAFIEWDFSCISNEITYAFAGTSIFKITEQKIYFIHEYRMTHLAFEWQGDILNSD